MSSEGSPRGIPREEDLETIEVQLLLEGIHRKYGFDFKDYAPSLMRRKLWNRTYAEQLKSISGLQEKVLHDSDCMERLLSDLSVKVTTMFRDPGFFKSFRTKIVPFLETYPFIRIWHAGCSTGEEVFSMAILLKEEGLLDRARIYATDINVLALEKAKSRIFALKRMKEFTNNYIQCGGKRSFSEYYTAKYDGALFDATLLENVVFAQHNLVTDGSFNEFNVILCRNVMIFFNKTLQSRVHQLIYDSLVTLGVLGLGNSESVTFSSHEHNYETVDRKTKLYRKIN